GGGARGAARGAGEPAAGETGVRPDRGAARRHPGPEPDDVGLPKNAAAARARQGGGACRVRTRLTFLPGARRFLPMPRPVSVFLSAIACLAVSCGAPHPQRAADDAAASRPKVLYLTHSAGFKHDVVPLSMRLLPEIGRQHGFDVVVTKDLTFLSPEGLK